MLLAGGSCPSLIVVRSGDNAITALDPSRAADIGAIEFLKKPLDFDRLLELVRQYCD